jgi:Reverse transcriptase (RNA-dependent DNA polymerase)
LSNAGNLPTTDQLQIIASEAPRVPVSENVSQEDTLEDTRKRRIDNISNSEGDDIQPIIPSTGSQMNTNPVHADRVGEMVTRSGRVSKAPAHHDDYVSIDSVFSIEVEEDQSRSNPYAYAVSSDPDVLHYRQALKQPDRKQFIEAMVKEIKAHTDGGNWKIIHRSKVPKGHHVLPAVWAMRRKRHIDTREVYKWKARINIHGGTKQIKGVNYWDTYAPVATWPLIRVIMNMAAIHCWVARQLDFVLAFPQAPVETDLYMEIPQGFVVDGVNIDPADYVLKLVNNLYGQKQAGRVWYRYLTHGLCTKLGFTQSKHDPAYSGEALQSLSYIQTTP